MENGTYFYLMLFENVGYIRYAFFGLGSILYCAIVFFNALIILAIFLERTSLRLHQPMYILILCLSVNSVFGTAVFFPRLLTDLLWIYLILYVGIAGILKARLTMCGNKLWKVYCQNFEIDKLSCANTIVTNVFVLYSYVKILIICRKSSLDFRRKAYQTCIPHIVILLNFSVAIFCEVTLSRVATLELPIGLSIILSLEFLIVSPILNPLVYGLKFPEICKKNSMDYKSFQTAVTNGAQNVNKVQ
uniref:G-protein coupled receptors family 1 profile domain-containing protein n=1 Tax=Cyprinus carpio TaxID=7962 RepID=A0A8C1XKB3_CYPCA